MSVGDSRTYTDVTQAIFDCVKTKSKTDHGTVYDPPNGNTGTATTQTTVGEVKLSFDLDLSAKTLKYVILEEPGAVFNFEIWDGICGAIKFCGGTC